MCATWRVSSTRAGTTSPCTRWCPHWRTRAFGLPDRCNRWLGPYLAPIYAMRRIAARTRVAESANHLLSVAIDQVAARLVAPCDVLIGMSQLSLACIGSVRRRFGARTFLERGSRHIVSQRQILAGIAVAGAAQRPVPDWAVRRELAEYERVDMIVVPSTHAHTSFVERGVSASKLFRNPYGVDLTMFPATPAPPPDAPPTIIMVGAWSLRKGCDVLVDAWQRLATQGTRLMHVGPIADAPLPAGPRVRAPRRRRSAAADRSGTLKRTSWHWHRARKDSRWCRRKPSPADCASPPATIPAPKICESASTTRAQSPLRPSTTPQRSPARSTTNSLMRAPCAACVICYAPHANV